MSKGKAKRVVKGLVQAEVCARPSNIPVSRPRGRKGAGIKYERDLSEGLKTSLIGIMPVWHGQWYRFFDSNGFGVCQTDILVKTSVGIAVLESKYTWTEAGHVQLEKLYIPVVEKAHPGLPAFGIVVCKVLTAEVHPSWICRDLATAIARSASGLKTVLHWVGVGLEPLKSPA